MGEISTPRGPSREGRGAKGLPENFKEGLGPLNIPQSAVGLAGPTSSCGGPHGLFPLCDVTHVACV